MTSSNVVIEQALNKILSEGDSGFIDRLSLTEEYFFGYEDEYYFVLDHIEKYGNVPDKMTFAAQFPKFNFFPVAETEEYLYENLFDNRYYNYFADAWQAVVAQLSDDPKGAVEKLKSMLEIAPKYRKSVGVDIVRDAIMRLESLINKSKMEQGFFIPSGFDEIDVPFNGGWARGEDFIMVFGRTGNGKTFVLLKMLQSAFNFGNRVGFISPEMSNEKVGFRFDTLKAGFSNTSLNSGTIMQDELMFNKYSQYVQDLSKTDNCFIVAETKDFDKKITVSKLRNFIVQNRLDILGIDGMTYLSDERYKKGDNKTSSLGNLSEDLIVLSKELGVPIIVAVQANRGGVKGEEDDGTPELEHVRDSDAISHSCTKIISIRQRHDRVDLCIKKNRDNANGQLFSYYFDPNMGVFQFEAIERNSNSYRPQIPAGQQQENRAQQPQGNTRAKNNRRVVEF